MLHRRVHSASCVSVGCLESSMTGYGSSMYKAHGTEEQLPPAITGVSIPLLHLLPDLDEVPDIAKPAESLAGGVHEANLSK